MPTLVLKDYYSVIGVERSASPEEIKKAYRRRSRAVHPDLLGPDASEADLLEANELFKEIALAAEYLLDTQKKQAVDGWLVPACADPPASGSGFNDYGDFWSRRYRPPNREPLVVPKPESYCFDGVWCWIEYSAGVWSQWLRATVRVPLDELFQIYDLSVLPHGAILTEVLAFDRKGEVVGSGYSLGYLRNEIRKLQAQARRNEKRRYWRDQIACLKEQYDRLTAQGLPTAQLQAAISKASKDVESGRAYLRYAEQESTVVRSIREAEKEAKRVETVNASELLLADLLSGKIAHPHVDCNAAYLKRLDVFDFRTGGLFGIPTAKEVTEHYRRRMVGLTHQSQVLQANLSLEDEIPTILQMVEDGDLELSPDTIPVNGNKGLSSYPVQYGRAKVNGEFVPAGMIVVPESVYERNGAEHGRASQFPTLPHGIVLVIRVKVVIRGEEMLTDPYPDGKQLRNEVRRCRARLRSPKEEVESFSSLVLSDFWQY